MKYDLDLPGMAKMKKTMTRALYALGHGDRVEDCMQDLIELWLQGKALKQSIPQFCIDWCRKNFGDNRFEKSGKLKLLRASQYEENSNIENRVDVERQITDQLTSFKMLQDLKVLDRIMFKLYYEWGLDYKELAELYGISEGRMGFRMKRLNAKVKRGFYVKAKPKRGKPNS